MKKVIIHAGLPKTGSTFLQTNVFPSIPEAVCAYNPESLRRQIIAICKQIIVQGPLSEAEIAKQKKFIDSQLESVSQDTLLISVEGILPVHIGEYSHADNILAALKQLFHEPLILVVVREQAAWIRSVYSFCLVHNWVLPFEQFVNKQGDGSFGERTNDGLGVSVYNYKHQQVFELVQKHFDDVIFLQFEALFSDQESALAKLAEILGVDKLTVKATEKVNQGLDERLMVITSKVVRLLPFRAPWLARFFYTGYANLSFWEVLQHSYLDRSGSLARMIARQLHKLTNCYADRALFSETDKKRIKEFYAQPNRVFWNESITVEVSNHSVK